MDVEVEGGQGGLRFGCGAESRLGGGEDGGKGDSFGSLQV